MSGDSDWPTLSKLPNWDPAISVSGLPLQCGGVKREHRPGTETGS